MTEQRERLPEEEILRRLKDRNEKAAFDFAGAIGAASAESDLYADLVPLFAGMLTERNAFTRTRAFFLICDQARWDTEGRIAAVFDRMVPLLNDEKPTVVRQCLGALKEVVLFRPELAGRIETAVRNIDLSRCRDSMTGLIRKDMDALLKLID
ncbi:MAG: hypothetical protein CW338_01655 [Clostridiales bacterium]|nr:hypothetical protein [Clostridiales bacterium]